MASSPAPTPPPSDAPPAPDGNENANVNANANENVNAPAPAGANANIPLAAPGLNIPGKPVVILLNATQVKIIIDPNGNTVPTLFAIQDSVSGKFVQADGTLGSVAAYQTLVGWGGDTGVIVKVIPNTRYKFRVVAKKGE